MRLIYTFIFYCALPLVVLRLLWRARKAPLYKKRMAERFGWVKTIESERPLVWLHTVSVGEFLAALPLIRKLQQASVLLLITTTTPTGSEQVKATLGDSVFHVYAPYDLPDCLARFLARVKPALLLIMETELWPNTLFACHRRAIPVVLINGRLSERSARGYQRFAATSREMLECLSAAAIQHKDDALRFQRLGLPASSINVTGNIKFDLTLTAELQARAVQLKAQWSQNGQRSIWIAASTHQGEDEIILDAFALLRQSALLPAQKLLLVLVPRHPERFTTVATLCRERGYQVSTRSSGANTDTADVLVGDTMGELLLLFGASDIAFVGGSLVPRGGHNFMEPAAWGLPLISGHHVFNFVEAAQLLSEAGALTFADSAASLAKEVSILLEDPEQRERRGAAAARVVAENRGALDKTLILIKSYL